MAKPLIIANWKMNPASRAAVRGLFGNIRRGLATVRGVEVVIAPPFPYLALFRPSGKVKLAAQDVFWEERGAYTGEVSPRMLKDLGVRYVIIGHSERRRIFGEGGEVINRKVRAVLEAGLIPVVAIGEEALASNEVVPQELARQLSQALLGIPPKKLAGAVVAYEPVWAISTRPGSRSDTPDNATRRAIYIRKLLMKMLSPRTADTIRVIYGGSVNAKNGAEFISPDIRGMEGLLVGGASLNPKEFVEIVRSVSRHRAPEGYEMRKRYE